MKTLCILAILLTVGASDALSVTAEPQEMPQVKKKVNPAYPEILKKAGIEGEVMVKVLIDENGRVEKAESVKATKPEFAESSLLVIKLWEFTPATKDGKPIKAEVLVPINFKLGDKSAKTQSEQQLKLQDNVTKIIKGEVSEDLKDFIEPEAYAVAGGKYESLYSLVFDKRKENPLVEGQNYQTNFFHMGTSVSEDAAVLVMKSASGKSKRDRFDTVILMKTADGVWKIHSWHMSK